VMVWPLPGYFPASAQCRARATAAPMPLSCSSRRNRLRMDSLLMRPPRIQRW
jgi:hypothetical protein